MKKLLEQLQRVKLQLLILQLQLRVKLLQQKLTIPNLNKPSYIIIHHGGGDLNFEQVNEYYKKKWGFKSSLGYYIGYQYFIEYDGTVHQGRADNEEGAHTVGNQAKYFNRNAIGTCLQGNTDNKEPTERQLIALRDLNDRKKIEYSILNEKVLGHREVTSTFCPGRHLWRWLIANYAL